jgi:hypothetical protein
MKNLIIACLFCIGLVGASSCYKEKNWLDENVNSTNRFFPNIFFNTLDSANYPKGFAVRCNFEYWSQDKIKEIRIYDSIGTAARKVVATLAYTPAYSAIKKSDTLLYQYVVPATAASGTTIRLDAVVENENGLTRLSNRLSFRVR